MPNEIGYSFARVSTNPIETDRQVNTITLRDAIPSGKRWEGMLVYVISEQTTYELKGGILNTDWAEIGGTDTTATHYRGEFDATALDPAIDNSNGVQGDEYKVINGGVNVDFGAGDVFLETGDIIIFHNSLWGVKVSPNYGSSYLVPYQLATAGQTVIPVDAEFVNVSLTINRVPQVKDVDFTFTSGTITMLYALTEDDLIDVRGYKLDGEYPSNLQPIPNVYDDLADLIAHQASQLTGYIYEVTDASDFTGIDSGKLWVRYLGTTLGTEADYSWQPRPTSTVLEEDVFGTCTENLTTTGALNLDISAFSSHRAILTGNTVHTLTGLPASVKTIPKTLYVNSTTTETYEIDNATYTVGSYVNDGSMNRVTIEVCNFASGNIITVTYENLI